MATKFEEMVNMSDPELRNYLQRTLSSIEYLQAFRRMCAVRLEYKSCEWTYDEEYGEHYASCGLEWVFTEGGVKENGVFYCPKCGKPIVEKLMDVE